MPERVRYRTDRVASEEQYWIQRDGFYPIIPELFRELGTAEVLGDGPYLCLLVMVTRRGDLQTDC